MGWPTLPPALHNVLGGKGKEGWRNRKPIHYIPLEFFPLLPCRELPCTLRPHSSPHCRRVCVCDHCWQYASLTWTSKLSGISCELYLLMVLVDMFIVRKLQGIVALDTCVCRTEGLNPVEYNRVKAYLSPTPSEESKRNSSLLLTLQGTLTQPHSTHNSFTSLPPSSPLQGCCGVDCEAVPVEHSLDCVDCCGRWRRGEEWCLKSSFSKL